MSCPASTTPLVTKDLNDVSMRCAIRKSPFASQGETGGEDSPRAARDWITATLKSFSQELVTVQLPTNHLRPFESVPDDAFDLRPSSLLRRSMGAET
jgi:hypothetical protein